MPINPFLVDYWAYCANKTCANHEGSGVSSSCPEPEWAKI